MLLSLFLVGCATTHTCNKPYSESEMRCEKKRRIPTKDLVKYCVGRAPRFMTCYYVSQEQMRDIMRDLNR